jgi:hypothetical protein
MLIGVPMSGSTQTSFLLHTGTALVQAEDGNGDFLLGDLVELGLRARSLRRIFLCLKMLPEA